jgi:hypothetical protein
MNPKTRAPREKKAAEEEKEKKKKKKMAGFGLFNNPIVSHFVNGRAHWRCSAVKFRFQRSTFTMAATGVQQRVAVRPVQAGDKRQIVGPLSEPVYGGQGKPVSCLLRADRQTDRHTRRTFVLTPVSVGPVQTT